MCFKTKDEIRKSVERKTYQKLLTLQKNTPCPLLQPPLQLKEEENNSTEKGKKNDLNFIIYISVVIAFGVYHGSRVFTKYLWHFVEL